MTGEGKQWGAGVRNAESVGSSSPTTLDPKQSEEQMNALLSSVLRLAEATQQLARGILEANQATNHLVEMLDASLDELRDEDEEKTHYLSGRPIGTG